MNSDFKLTANAMPTVPGRVRDVIRDAIGGFQGVFRRPQGEQSDFPRQERCTNCALIANELHDTLFQGFLGASMLLHSTGSPPASLGQALSEIRNEFTSGNSARFRILVAGKPKALNPGIREQIFLIGREAVVNALRHSGATNIEVEVEYLRSRTRVLVRDDGCGIDPEVVRSGRNSHWGLPGMRERAKNFGGKLEVWSEQGAGTEIEVTIPAAVAYGGSNARSRFWFLRKRNQAIDGHKS